jgi:hypothetical protein
MYVFNRKSVANLTNYTIEVHSKDCGANRYKIEQFLSNKIYQAFVGVSRKFYHIKIGSRNLVFSGI